MEAMNRKIGVGVLWNLANLLMAKGAATLFTLFLAFFLTPEAFGLIAMATVVFELANVLIDSGLGQALIRSSNASAADFDTVFYTNLMLSVLAYIALFAGAPVFADFYGQPELTYLIQVMGLVVFINATKLIQVVVFSRDMDFKSQMKANTCGVFISGILAVSAAWFGWGVWSLVVQMLGSALVASIVLWSLSSWRPSLQFSKESFIRLFRFGRNLLLEGLLSVLFRNSYVLVIGRFFSAEITGLYFFARKINDLISKQLTNAVQQATYPALSTLQDENETLRHKYRQVMQLMMFLIAPIMALVAGLSEPLFELILHEKWIGAVPFLQLLCVVGAISPLHSLNISLLNVKGRSDLVLKIGLLKKAVNLMLLLMAIPFGVIGIIVGQIIGTMLALVPNTYFSEKLVKYTLAQQVKDIIKPLLVAALSGISAWYISSVNGDVSIPEIGLGAFCGVAFYLLLSLVLRVEGLGLCWKVFRNSRFNRIFHKIQG